VNHLHPPPTRRSHKQHWSIALLALKAQITFLGAVRKALRRTDKIGITTDASNQINKYTQDWVRAVTDLRIEDETHLARLLNWTGLGPNHYLMTYN
jgi:hypothetical protein